MGLQLLERLYTPGLFFTMLIRSFISANLVLLVGDDPPFGLCFLEAWQALLLCFGYPDPLR